MIEHTLVLIKPDAVRRRLIGEIITRFERKGLVIAAIDQRMLNPSMSDAHYAEHVDKPFYPALREFIIGGPLLAMALVGDGAINVVRTMIGATDGQKAAPGTIRGDFGLSVSENLVHASDSPEAAKREIALWFPGLAR